MITYAISLSEADWTLNNGTWNALMQNVTTLIVTMEYISGDEYNRLDNVILSFTPVSLPVLPVICSDFEAGGYDGWVFQNTGGVSNQGSGGNPGRYIRISDGSGTSTAIAPPKFLGDWSQIDNHAAEVRVDLKVSNFSGPLYLDDSFIRIAGPGGEARIPVDSSIMKAFNQWHTFAFPVEQSYWTMVSGNWSSLLNYVNELVIVVEFISGSEVVGMDNFCITDLPPVADFSADRNFVFLGEPVQFSDLSMNAPTSWQWDFGDGSTSTEENPVHVYSTPGIFDVSLTVSNHYGSSTETKQAFIEVYPVDQCIKFADDFNDNVIHPAWQLTNGSWSENGDIRQTSNYYGSGLLNGCYAVVGSPAWADYKVTCSLKSTDNDKIGIVFNFQDFQNMYMFAWNLQSPSYRRLYKWENGAETLLASDDIGYSTNQWYQLEIISNQGNISVSVDGTEIFTANDNTFANGKVGLWCHGNQSSYWDDFEVSCLGYAFDLTLMLQGPYTGPGMDPNLNGLPEFPLSQPYNAAPWNYSGTEVIAAVPDPGIVDWILLELRDAPDPSLAVPATMVARKAAFLKSDGSVTGMDGSGLPVVSFDYSDNLYAVIWHRNHLPLMSANPLVESGGTFMYDFTTGAGQIYGGTLAATEVEPGVWALTGGDGNADFTIGNPDKLDVWAVQAGSSGYVMGDYDMDGQVANSDKIDVWAPNGGKSSQVPD